MHTRISMVAATNALKSVNVRAEYPGFVWTDTFCYTSYSYFGFKTPRNKENRTHVVRSSNLWMERLNALMATVISCLTERKYLTNDRGCSCICMDQFCCLPSGG